MSWPRVRIWWLMALVAAVALTMVWWQWHLVMLARSAKYLSWVVQSQRFMASEQQVAVAYRNIVAEFESTVADLEQGTSAQDPAPTGRTKAHPLEVELEKMRTHTS